jgi:hypothetical protein
VDIDDMALLMDNVTVGQYEQNPAIGKVFWHHKTKNNE